MSSDGPSEQARERARRRRAAALLGDLLPDTTGDERGEDGAATRGERDDDLRRDVPPHHGG